MKYDQLYGDGVVLKNKKLIPLLNEIKHLAGLYNFQVLDKKFQKTNVLFKNHQYIKQVQNGTEKLIRITGHHLETGRYSKTISFFVKQVHDYLNQHDHTLTRNELGELNSLLFEIVLLLDQIQLVLFNSKKNIVFF